MGTQTDPNDELDLHATAYVRSIIGMGGDWELIKPDRDKVGLDYQVVLRSEDGVPETTFFIQQKGRGPRRSKGKIVPLISKEGHIREPIELEHLEFYMKLREPVFLIVVDVTERRGYWLFVQKYMRQDVTGDWLKPLRQAREDKRKGKRVNMPEMGIRVPKTNYFGDKDSFKAAVRQARDYMISSGINEGIDHERRRLEELDPRFEVKLDIINGKQHVTLNAKQRVKFKFVLPSDKGEDLIGRALPVKLEPGELTVVGHNPHWEEFSRAGGMLHFRRETPAYVNLIHLDSANQIVGRFDGIPCLYAGGSLQYRFTSATASDVLKFQGAIVDKGSQQKFNSVFSYKAWCGEKLLNLPCFDPLMRLIGTDCSEASRLQMEFFVPGQRLAVGNLSEGCDEYFSGLREIIRPLAQAREIAKALKINPKTPKSLRPRSMGDIEFMYELATDPNPHVREADLTVRASMQTDDPSNLRTALKKGGEPGDFQGTIGFKCDFFNYQLVLPEVEFKLTNPRIVEDLDTDRGEGSFPVVISSTENSVYTLRAAGDGLKQIIATRQPKKHALR